MATFVKATTAPSLSHSIPRWLAWINLDLVATVETVPDHPNRAGEPPILRLLGPDARNLGYCTVEDFHEARATAAKQMERLREAIEELYGAVMVRH